MADIKPFRAIRYATDAGIDLSPLVAPPYDVLDGAGKATLLARSPFNIVEVDLPHVPPKTLGPDSAYQASASTYRAWQQQGVLRQDVRPALYPFEQTFSRRIGNADRTFHRRGFFALVRLTPFGVDVIPHEQTYAGAIEDRLRLMQATGAQLSPVFGLFFDPANKVTTSLFAHCHRPIAHADLDGTRFDLWAVPDASVEDEAVQALRGKPIYIADGHHRYTTALQFQRLAEEQHLREKGTPLPADHPANYALFALIAAEDPGLIVLPTHRLIGSLKSVRLETLVKLVEPHFAVGRVDRVEPAELIATLRHDGANTIGLYLDRTLVTLKLKDALLMRNLEPQKSDAWRGLDVAIVQRYLIEEVLTRQLNGGDPVTRGYTADDAEAFARVDSGEYQLSLLLQSTPTRALQQLGESGEVMPPKSTFFYPKLPTGMVIAPLGA